MHGCNCNFCEYDLQLYLSVSTSGINFFESFLNPFDVRYDNGLTFVAQNHLPLNQSHYILSREKHIKVDVRACYAYVAF